MSTSGGPPPPLRPRARGVKNGKLRRLFIGDFAPGRLARSVVVVYALMAGAAYLFTDSIIFQPPAASYRDDASVLKIPVAGTNETISAYHLKNPASRVTILYSHGNGNDIGQVRFHLEELRDRGYSVLAYDYEGYGTSSGRPSEAAVYRDVDAAYAYLRETLGVPADRIVAYGFSLGGAAAVDLATRRELAGVILESSFVTAFKVRTRIALVPFDKFDNLSKMKRLRRPLLVLHSRDDGLIGHWQASALYDAALEPKTLLLLDGGGHGAAAWAEPDRYWAAFDAFIASLQPR